MTDATKKTFAEAIIACQKAVTGANQDSSMYKDAIAQLKSVLPNLPQEIQDIVSGKVNKKETRNL